MNDHVGIRFGGMNHELSPDAVVVLLEDLSPRSELFARLRGAAARALDGGEIESKLARRMLAGALADAAARCRACGKQQGARAVDPCTCIEVSA